MFGKMIELSLVSSTPKILDDITIAIGKDYELTLTLSKAIIIIVNGEKRLIEVIPNEFGENEGSYFSDRRNELVTLLLPFPNRCETLIGAGFLN